MALICKNVEKNKGDKKVKKQIHLTAEQLKGVQQAELEMLQEIERICEKNGIVYSIVGGTLLGAVRHGGFIPWDDDADVAMLRSEYEKFVRACKKDLDKERFYFQDMHHTPGYRWGYGKLRKRDTLFLRCGQEQMPYEQGIFVDIFPGDNVPDNEVARILHQLQSFILRKLMWAEVGKHTESNRWIRFLYKQMAKVPLRWNVRQVDKLMQKSNSRETRLIRALLFPAPKGKTGYPRKWYEKSIPVMFEGVQLHMMQGYRQYLPYKYGRDYMKLPPKEMRKIHPVSKLKL